LSLEDVEDETKIRKYYISALEENNYHLLPAMVYASGFVKRYARLLGLDEDEIVQDFKRLRSKDESREDEIQGAETIRERLNVPIKNVLVGLVFLIFVIWMGSYLIDYLASRNWGHNRVNPPPITNNPKPEPGGANTPTPVVKGVNLRISGTELCWIRATVDGQLIPDTMLQPGEVKEIKGNESVKLVLGNGGGVKIQYNGQDLGVPGERGKTVRLEFPPPS